VKIRSLRDRIPKRSTAAPVAGHNLTEIGPRFAVPLFVGMPTVPALEVLLRLITVPLELTPVELIERVYPTLTTSPAALASVH
jgi:hypothetical protein